jgi:two-component system response regulator YesN
MENEKLMNLYSSTLQMFLQLIVKYIDCQVVSLDVRHFMIMFQCPSTSATDNRSAILNAIENTCKMLKNYYNISIRAGIGRITMQPFELSDSYYDARQMLARTSENEPFCFYDELPDNETVKNIFNMAIFKDDIRAAYEEMNHEKLRSIFASITELFTLYPSHYIQAMDAAGSILYLTISLLPVGEKIVCDIFADDADNYRSLYKQTSTEQIVGWMNKLCDGLCAFFISQKKDYKNHIVSNVKSYIHENLDKKLSLNEVAAAFGISPAYLSSLFGKYSDMGFVDYVNSAKIQEAKDMLQSSNDKIYEIADKLGFESAFYFSKVFKKVEGCSPREYLSRF